MNFKIKTKTLIKFANSYKIWLNLLSYCFRANEWLVDKYLLFDLLKQRQSR